MEAAGGVGVWLGEIGWFGVLGIDGDASGVAACSDGVSIDAVIAAAITNTIDAIAMVAAHRSGRRHHEDVLGATDSGYTNATELSWRLCVRTASNANPEVVSGAAPSLNDAMGVAPLAVGVLVIDSCGARIALSAAIA